MFTSTVEKQIEAAHHNGPPSSRCHINHGHSWHFRVVLSFGEAELDEHGWGVDFGIVKSLIEELDHTDLNEHPLLDGLMPSAENLCRVIFFETIQRTGKQPDYVEVHEGKGNTMRYTCPTSQVLVDPRG